MIRQLETARLILRPLELADADEVQKLFPRWEVVKFLAAAAVPWPYPEDGALTYYRDQALPAMQRGDEWYWSLRLKSDAGRLIGLISLSKGEKNNRGFWLGLPWHGQGLMSEAAEAVTQYWFGELGFTVLRVCPKAVANAASRKHFGEPGHAGDCDYGIELQFAVRCRRRFGKSLPRNGAIAAVKHAPMKVGYRRRLNSMPRLTFLVLAALNLAPAAMAAALMPLPVKVEISTGRLLIDGSFQAAVGGASSDRLNTALVRFTARLARQTGIPIGLGQPAIAAHPALTVECAAPGGPSWPALRDDESYTNWTFRPAARG